jgi:predicted SprT family Zn-dependent metalloprotease
VKYQELITYYNKITEILKDRLPFVPALQLSNATTYYGSYWRKGSKSSITLSTKTCYPVDHDELIDTVSHELAHTIFPVHNKLHETATKHFVDIVNQCLGKEA